MIIINKKGPLHNAADRDHCLRYMMAVVLLKNGIEVETADYQDDSPWAKDPRVEALRSIITMEEDVQFTKDYHNPDIRSVGCSIEFFLNDGTSFSTRLEFLWVIQLVMKKAFLSCAKRLFATWNSNCRNLQSLKSWQLLTNLTSMRYPQASLLICFRDETMMPGRKGGGGI